ncbi:Holliday junction branch migration protein RuvA [bacterium]|nr:Holliday junction branch migration protein RuvA [bacterium]
MIAYLTGTVAIKTGDAIVLEVHGVGYRVGISEDVGEIGKTVTLHLSEVIREDRHDLYGFISPDALVLFEALIGVQGVGPKVGMKIMSAGSPDTIRRTILNGDVAFFTGISGVGKKTAQKIILDLKGILVEVSGPALQDDAADALAGLGYSKEDIAGVLPHVQGESSEERIKAALRMLGKK